MKENVVEFEKIKIGYSEQGASSKFYELKNQLTKLNELRIRFENLGLQWSISTIVDLFNGGAESESKMVRDIQQEVSRISIPGLRDRMQRELDDTVMHDFKQLRIDVKNMKPRCDVSFLEIKNGAIVLSDKGKSEIEESFTIYAETPEEMEIWSEAVSIVERLNALDDRLRPFGILAIARNDINEPSLIRMAFRNAETDPFVLKECNANGFRVGKR